MLNKTKFAVYLFLAIFLSFGLSLSFGSLLAWEAPGATPPDGNVPAPVNVGDNSQLKVGDLDILGNFTADGGTLLVSSSTHRIGIGGIVPSSLLEVNGNAEVTSLLDNDGSNFFDLGSTCSDNSYIAGISSTGAITCASSTAAGDITGITAGTGLAGGGTAGTVTINFNTTAIDADGDDCQDPLNDKLYWDGAVGRLTCGQDQTGGSSLWQELGGNIYRLTGNVGIGTTGPVSLLTVGDGSLSYPTAPAGTAAITLNSTRLVRMVAADGSANYQEYLNAYYDSTGTHKYVESRPANMFSTHAGTYSFNVAPSGTAGNNINWINSLYINNAGSVGIGTSTIAGNLHIHNSSSNALITLSSSPSTQQSHLHFVTKIMTNSATMSVGNKGWYLGARNDGYGTAVQQNDFLIWSFGNGVGGSWATSASLAIDHATNNVGIGTTNPRGLLDVGQYYTIQRITKSITWPGAPVPLFVPIGYFTTNSTVQLSVDIQGCSLGGSGLEYFISYGYNRTPRVYYLGTSDYPAGSAPQGLNQYVTFRYYKPAGVQNAYHLAMVVTGGCSGPPDRNRTVNAVVKVAGSADFNNAGTAVEASYLNSVSTLNYIYNGYEGNVGIGTANPGTNRLEVQGGPIKATGGLIIETRANDPATPVNGQIWLIN